MITTMLYMIERNVHWLIWLLGICTRLHKVTRPPDKYSGKCQEILTSLVLYRYVVRDDTASTMIRGADRLVHKRIQDRHGAKEKQRTHGSFIIMAPAAVITTTQLPAMELNLCRAAQSASVSFMVRSPTGATPRARRICPHRP